MWLSVGGCFVEKQSSAGPDPEATSQTEVSDTFSARVKVVEGADKPVPGAKLTLGGRTVEADGEGVIEVKDLDSFKEQLVQIEAEDHVPVVRNLYSWHQGGLTVRLAPTKEKTVPAARGGTIATTKAEVRIGGRSVSRADGSEYDGEVKIEHAAIGASPSALDKNAAGEDVYNPNKADQAAFGGTVAVAEDGNQRWLQAFGTLYMDLKTPDQEPLNIAPGRRAQVRFLVPLDANAKENDELPLMSLDEERNRWNQEGHCKVVRKDADRLECVGTVAHFSGWAFGEFKDAGQPPGDPTIQDLTSGLGQDAGDCVPQAPAYCSGQDLDCDGQPDMPEGGLTAQVWNDICASRQPGVAAWDACQQTAAAGGDAWDDDCDGVIADGDGDGFSATGEGDQYDCDDTDPAINPDAEEEEGDEEDENCDGFALDVDGDGFLASLHLQAFGSPSDQADCNDYLARVNPAATDASHILAAYFDPERNVHNERFCSLFDASGELTEAGEQALFDLNCDGFVSDLDGDGWTVPGDESLGADKAWDCNDLDPRVHPPGDFKPGPNGLPPTCETPTDAAPPACSPNLERFGGGDNFATRPRHACPILLGEQSQCVPVQFSDGSGFAGFFGCGLSSIELTNSDPQRPNTPGVLFGPCDFGAGVIPESEACGRGLFCQGPVNFSSTYRSILRARYGDNPNWTEDLNWGYCIPDCGDPCRPNYECSAAMPSCSVVDESSVMCGPGGM